MKPCQKRDYKVIKNMMISENWKPQWRCGLGLALLLYQGWVQAASEITERIEWKKIPIRLELTVGQERRVAFPSPVKVGVPSNLQPLLRTQNVNGTLYFMAQAPFDATRIMVQEIDSGQIYLFDVAASNKPGQNHPVQVFAREMGKTNKASPLTVSDTAPKYDYVTLTRFAAQQLYAPARLLRDRPGIVRTPVSRDPIDLVRGGAVDARPLVAWRAEGRYITAVKLTNRTKAPLTLDPRELRGSWLTATFQHHRLLLAGDEADTTFVHLISARPFEVSV